MNTLSVEIKDKLLGHSSPIYALTFQNETIYTAGSDKLVVEWQKQSYDKPTAIAKFPHSCYALLAENGRLWIGLTDGTLHCIAMASKNKLFEKKVASGAIFQILHTPEGIIVISEDGLCHMIKEYSVYRSAKISLKSLRHVVQQDENLFIATSDGEVVFIALKDLEIKYRFKEHQQSVFAVCLTEEYLISGGRDASLIVQDLGNGEVLHKIPAHLSTINSITYNKTQNILATASKDKSIRLWDAENLTLLKVLDANKFGSHTNSVNKLRWLSDDKSLISISDDRTGIIWKIERM